MLLLFVYHDSLIKDTQRPPHSLYFNMIVYFGLLDNIIEHLYISHIFELIFLKLLLEIDLCQGPSIH